MWYSENRNKETKFRTYKHKGVKIQQQQRGKATLELRNFKISQHLKSDLGHFLVFLIYSVIFEGRR